MRAKPARAIANSELDEYQELTNRVTAHLFGQHAPETEAGYMGLVWQQDPDKNKVGHFKPWKHIIEQVILRWKIT